MDAEEEPLSNEDDSDLDLNFDSEEENENCLKNKLKEEKILQFKQEKISKINQQIELLKNLHPDEIYRKLLPCDDKINTIITRPVTRDEPKSQIFQDGIAHSMDSSENIKRHSNSKEACSGSSKLYFDDVPVRKIPCKSFQEHLENVLKKDDTLDLQQQVEQKQTTKRVFLKKGQGLQRFERKKKQINEMTMVGKEKSVTSERALSDSSKSSSSGTRPAVTQKKSSPNFSASQRMEVQSTLSRPQKKLVMKRPLSNQNIKSTCQIPIKHIAELKDENHPSKSSQSDASSEARIADIEKHHLPKSDAKDGTQCNAGARDQNFGPDETQPLNEFEILEGYAMEDASFLSSISTVDKVMQLHHGISAQDKSNCKAIPKLPPTSSMTRVEKNSKAPCSDAVDRVASLPSIMPQGIQNNPSNNIVVLNMERKISAGSGNFAGNGFENASCGEDYFEHEGKTMTSTDNRFVLQRGEYVPGLYAGNDDTFSTDAGWTREHPEGDFEDNASWNDVTLVEDQSIGGGTKEEIKNILVEKASINQSNKGHLIMPCSSKASDSSAEDSVTLSRRCNQVDDRPVPTEDIFQSKPLREKALELDVEIERYRKENAALAQLRKEHASNLSSLKKEMEEFKKKRSAEVEEFEKFKNEEIQKLKKERRLFDMLKKSHDEFFFTREDRKVQDALKADLEKLREDTKLKEQRWKSNSERMKDRIDQLEKENMELKGKLISKEQEFLKMKSQSQDTHPASKKKSRERYSFEAGFVNRATSIPNPPCLVQSSVESEVILDKTSPYHNRIQANGGEVLIKDEVVRHQNLPDDSVKVAYAKVAKRVLNPDGSETIEFCNGDMQQNFSNGTKLYVFTEHNIRHYFYPDGLQIFYFPCGQVEKIFANGTKEIEFPNGNLKYVYEDGSEETILMDGTVIKSQTDGTIIKELTNGIKEMYYNGIRRIEYPDGGVKTIHKDGSQETRYASGRIRKKDPQGNLIYDVLKGC